jgi:single-stranded DNA-binding protein
MNGIECAFEARLAADPESKTSAAGKPWARLRCAVGDGDATQWVNVACFGDQATQATSVLHKGDRVYCEGTIRLERRQAQDGTERSGLSAAAWKVIPLGKIGRNKPPKGKAPPDGEHPVLASVGGAHGTNAATRDWQRPVADDAIPF